MKGIELCAECAYYNMKSHKCTRGCKIDPDSKKGEDIRFFVDCPLPDVQPVKHTENLSTVAFCDEFICKNCGIHLAEWIKLDVEDYEEYEFKFCPNCGARMDGDEE